MTDQPTRTRAPRKRTITKPTKADAEAFMYAALVNYHIDLAQEWQGWKIRGRYLVSPHGDRVCVRRLAGLLFTEKNRVKVAPKKGRADIVELIRRPINAERSR